VKDEKATKDSFWVAFEAATNVTARNPEDQPEKLNLLEVSLAKLDAESQKRLVFHIAKTVLEGETRIQSLFAVARIANMRQVAYNASVVKKILDEGLTFADLLNTGLVEIRKKEGGRPFTIYFFGREALEKASHELRTSGNIGPAKILDDHLRRGERHKLLAEAARS